MKPLYLAHSGVHLAVAAFAAALIPATAARADSTLALAGADGSKSASYGYLGAITRLGGGMDQSGWLLKAWADTMRYEYVSQGATVKADANGGQVALGYQWLRGGGYTTLYFGATTRDTSRSVNVLPARAGRQSGAVIELNFSQKLEGHTRLDAIMQYASKSRDHWSRARWARQSAQGFAWGPEVVVQGNPDYSAWRLGGFVGDVPLGANARIESNFGYAKNHALRGGAYGGISIVASF